MSYFSDVLLRHPDKSSFDIFVYSNVAKEDKKTVEFRELLAGKGGAGRWREVYGKGGGEVAEMIWKDGIDILVELGGHTAGSTPFPPPPPFLPSPSFPFPFLSTPS